MITVIIDAGHGGKDSGAVYGHYREKDQTLGIAKRLQVKLAEKNNSTAREFSAEDFGFTAAAERTGERSTMC